jgi:hypothetical protein
MAAKFQRQIDIKWQISGNDAESMEYNPAAGACKSLRVGPRLLPIPTGLGTWTTNVTTATALPNLGDTLYIYNNSGTAGSITVGQTAAVTAQAIGAVDANGNVGVACAPNAWTYLSMGINRWVVSNSANLVVYIVEDPTRFVEQSGPFMQQNNGNTQPIS